MTSSFRRGIVKVIAVMVTGILAGIFLELFFPYLGSLYPPINIYTQYIRDAIFAILIFGFTVIISKLIRELLERLSQKGGGRNFRGTYVVIRAFLYGVAILLFLSYLGVSLTGALIGGTIGGLIISFALQNTISGILMGLMLASAGIVKPGDPISFHSWLFDSPVIGVVKDVKILTVEVETINGNVVELPTSALMGQTQITNLRDLENRKNGAFSVTLGFPVDADPAYIMEIGSDNLRRSMEEIGLIKFDVFFFSKTFNTNSLKVVFTFKSMAHLNACISTIHLSFEKAYQTVKKQKNN